MTYIINDLNNILLIFCFSSFFALLFNYFFLKFSFCLDKIESSKHKRLTSNKKIPLSLGFVFLLSLLLIFYNNKILLIFATSIFLIGVYSDLNLLENPYKKFLIQALLVITFIYLEKLTVLNTKVYFIDIFLDNFIFNILFTTFCFLILINGNNFIDGINGLVILNSFFIILTLFITSTNFPLRIDLNMLIKLTILLTTLFFFNISGKSFLGDNGSFSIGFILGYLVIDFHHNNPYVSPYFIVAILWYPAYEIFFSIIRKLISNKSPFKADNYHLHQLLFLYFKKISDNKKFSNFFSTTSICLTNLIFYIFYSNNIYSSKILIFLLSVYSLIYLFVYIMLRRHNSLR